MFKFINGLFDSSSTANLQEGFSGNTPYDKEFPKYPEEESPYLSQAEIQMLQHMVAQYIRTHEQVRKEFKEEALSYPVGDEMRNMLFREHREIKAKLKKLSALQYRLKHKIAARG